MGDEAPFALDWKLTLSVHATSKFVIFEPPFCSGGWNVTLIRPSSAPSPGSATPTSATTDRGFPGSVFVAGNVVVVAPGVVVVGVDASTVTVFLAAPNEPSA